MLRNIDGIALFLNVITSPGLTVGLLGVIARVAPPMTSIRLTPGSKFTVNVVLSSFPALPSSSTSMDVISSLVEESSVNARRLPSARVAKLTV